MPIIAACNSFHRITCRCEEWKKEYQLEYWKKEKEKVMLIEKMMQEEKKSRTKYDTNKGQRIAKNEPVDELE